jgi:hypothetical protein
MHVEQRALGPLATLPTGVIRLHMLAQGQDWPARVLHLTQGVPGNTLDKAVPG